ALLDDERGVLNGRDDHGQDEGLEHTHVVADEYAGAGEGAKVIDALDLDPDSDVLERAERLHAACAPFPRIITSLPRFSARLPDNAEYVAVEHKRRHQAGWKGKFACFRLVGVT